MEHFALMMYLMIFLLKQKIASINMSKREWSPGVASLIRLMKIDWRVTGIFTSAGSYTLRT